MFVEVVEIGKECHNSHKCSQAPLSVLKYVMFLIGHYPIMFLVKYNILVD